MDDGLVCRYMPTRRCLVACTIDPARRCGRYEMDDTDYVALCIRRVDEPQPPAIRRVHLDLGHGA